MALAGALITGGVRAGGALLNYFQRRKRRTPTFASTPYGKRLQQISKRGIYSPSAKSTMLGETSRRLSASIQPEIARRRGVLESKGMGKSIAGARYTGEPALERARGVGEATRRIELENELAKERAATEFARGQTATEAQRRTERTGETQALVGGLTEAASAGLGMYMKGKQLKMQEKSLDIRNKQIESIDKHRTELENLRRQGLEDTKEYRGKTLELRKQQIENIETNREDLLDLREENLISDEDYRTKKLELDKRAFESLDWYRKETIRVRDKTTLSDTKKAEIKGNIEMDLWKERGYDETPPTTKEEIDLYYSMVEARYNSYIKSFEKKNKNLPDFEY